MPHFATKLAHESPDATCVVEHAEPMLLDLCVLGMRHTELELSAPFYSQYSHLLVPGHCISYTAEHLLRGKCRLGRHYPIATAFQFQETLLFNSDVPSMQPGRTMETVQVIAKELEHSNASGSFTFPPGLNCCSVTSDGARGRSFRCHRYPSHRPFLRLCEKKTSRTEFCNVHVGEQSGSKYCAFL